MVIVRLYKITPTGKKKYISKIIHKAKNKKHIQVNLTGNKDNAQIFKTTEEIFEFYAFLESGKRGVVTDDLQMEREETDKTFEEVFGEDVLKESRVEKMNFLAAKDFYEGRALQVMEQIKELEKINLDELSEDAKIEVEKVKVNLQKEHDLYIVELNLLMEENQ